MRNESLSRKIFVVFNYIIITFVTILCMVPIINVLAMSFSDASSIAAGRVTFLPKGFTLDAYEYVMKSTKFWQASWVSIKRVLIGVPLNTALTILAAYPLSKSEEAFHARKYYSWFFLVTMVFNGGLIPTYITVAKLGLIDSIWALILPGAVPVFNVVLLLNFFRNIPDAIEESARVEGASQVQILMKIILPLAKPALATITLFAIVNHWNEWFAGLIYSNKLINYPLQSYLQTIVTSVSNTNIMDADLKSIMERINLNKRNLNAAQIFVSTLPLLVIYPFLQKHFTTGIVMGSVKE